jgi:hypothetical protein
MVEDGRLPLCRGGPVSKQKQRKPNQIKKNQTKPKVSGLLSNVRDFQKES